MQWFRPNVWRQHIFRHELFSGIDVRIIPSISDFVRLIEENPHCLPFAKGEYPTAMRQRTQSASQWWFCSFFSNSSPRCLLPRLASTLKRFSASNWVSAMMVNSSYRLLMLILRDVAIIALFVCALIRCHRAVVGFAGFHPCHLDFL